MTWTVQKKRIWCALSPSVCDDEKRQGTRNAKICRSSRIGKWTTESTEIGNRDAGCAARLGRCIEICSRTQRTVQDQDTSWSLSWGPQKPSLIIGRTEWWQAVQLKSEVSQHSLLYSQFPHIVSNNSSVLLNRRPRYRIAQVWPLSGRPSRGLRECPWKVCMIKNRIEKIRTPRRTVARTECEVFMHPCLLRRRFSSLVDCVTAGLPLSLLVHWTSHKCYLQQHAMMDQSQLPLRCSKIPPSIWLNTQTRNLSRREVNFKLHLHSVWRPKRGVEVEGGTEVLGGWRGVIKFAQTGLWRGYLWCYVCSILAN